MSDETSSTETTGRSNSRKNGGAAKFGYAAGGGVAGAATSSAFSQNTSGDEEPLKTDIAEDDGVLVAEPEPDGEILETSTFAPIAHVSDEMTFAEAFSDARHQVGDGGVFEWRGHVYGTYYANEWNDMSAAERADFNSRVDYDAAHIEHEAYYGHQEPPSKIDVDPEPPVKVNSIQLADCEFGKDGKAIIAELDMNGQPAVLFDLNQDGHFDLLITDLDENGILDENDIADISEWNIELNDLTSICDEPVEVYLDGAEYLEGAIADFSDFDNDGDVDSFV